MKTLAKTIAARTSLSVECTPLKGARPGITSPLLTPSRLAKQRNPNADITLHIPEKLQFKEWDVSLQDTEAGKQDSTLVKQPAQANKPSRKQRKRTKTRSESEEESDSEEQLDEPPAKRRRRAK